MEQNQLSAGESSGNGSSSLDRTIGFITEFNTNAQIFNETLGPLLMLHEAHIARLWNESAGQDEAISELRESIRNLARLVGTSQLGRADNTSFTESHRRGTEGASSGASMTSHS